MCDMLPKLPTALAYFSFADVASRQHWVDVVIIQTDE